ncbi:hypothetical protein LCGC14_1670500 [marine sediment metagenome]|uniref:Ead/Ea22-like family protein n=1 Tax=marine sediment metagenome TaxID=412755 RepID=A0A0F9IE31_9ZZZZ
MNKRLEEIRERFNIAEDTVAHAPEMGIDYPDDGPVRLEDMQFILDLVDTQAKDIKDWESSYALQEVVCNGAVEMMETNADRLLEARKQIAEKDEVYDEWRGIAERQRDKLIAKDKQIAEGVEIVEEYRKHDDGGWQKSFIDIADAWLKAVKDE